MWIPAQLWQCSMWLLYDHRWYCQVTYFGTVARPPLVMWSNVFVTAVWPLLLRVDLPCAICVVCNMTTVLPFLSYCWVTYNPTTVFVKMWMLCNFYCDCSLQCNLISHCNVASTVSVAYILCLSSSFRCGPWRCVCWERSCVIRRHASRTTLSSPCCESWMHTRIRQKTYVISEFFILWMKCLHLLSCGIFCFWK